MNVRSIVSSKGLRLVATVNPMMFGWSHFVGFLWWRRYLRHGGAKISVVSIYALGRMLDNPSKYLNFGLT